MRLNPLKCAFEVVSGKILGYKVNKIGIVANLEKIKALIEMSYDKTQGSAKSYRPFSSSKPLRLKGN